MDTVLRDSALGDHCCSQALSSYSVHSSLPGFTLPYHTQPFLIPPWPCSHSSEWYHHPATQPLKPEPNQSNVQESFRYPHHPCTSPKGSGSFSLMSGRCPDLSGNCGFRDISNHCIDPALAISDSRSLQGHGWAVSFVALP